MTISLKIRRTAAIATTALALALGAFAATPAQAHSAAPLVPAAANAALSPHGTVSSAPHILCDTIVSRGTTIALCSTGTYYDGGHPYRWPITHLNTTLTANRVWFHQNPNGSGWATCFSGGGSYNITGREQHPGNILISLNTAHC